MGTVHFGIGDATSVDRAEVLWPSGRVEVFDTLKANQVAILQEGKGQEGKGKLPAQKTRHDRN